MAMKVLRVASADGRNGVREVRALVEIDGVAHAAYVWEYYLPSNPDRLDILAFLNRLDLQEVLEIVTDDIITEQQWVKIQRDLGRDVWI